MSFPLADCAGIAGPEVFQQTSRDFIDSRVMPGLYGTGVNSPTSICTVQPINVRYGIHAVHYRLLSGSVRSAPSGQ